MHSSLVTFGFLPVLVFLLVDTFAGKPRALWSALAAGAAQFTFSIMKDHALDFFGVAGFALLASLVFVSLRTRDDFYFKIQGPLLNAVSALALLIGWFVFHKALLLDVAAREIGLDKLASLDPSLTRDSVAEMLRVLSFYLPWWLILHALATVYAAANWGKWAWAFIRVPGFVIMLFLASGFAQAAAMQGLK